MSLRASRSRKAILGLALAALVSACTPEPAEFGQCSPGVGDISRTATTCP